MPNEDLGTGKHGCQRPRAEPRSPPEIHLPRQTCCLLQGTRPHSKPPPAPAILVCRAQTQLKDTDKDTAMPLQLLTQHHQPYHSPAATHRPRFRNGRAQLTALASFLLPLTLLCHHAAPHGTRPAEHAKPAAWRARGEARAHLLEAFLHAGRWFYSSSLCFGAPLPLAPPRSLSAHEDRVSILAPSQHMQGQRQRSGKAIFCSFSPFLHTNTTVPSPGGLTRAFPAA